MHGEEAGRVVYRQLTIGSSFDLEVGRSCSLFIKQIDAGRSRGFRVSWAWENNISTG